MSLELADDKKSPDQAERPRALIQFTMRAELADRLKALAEKRDMPYAIICRQAVEAMLDEVGA